MSAEEVSQRLNNLAEAIAENIPTITQEIAVTAKSKVQERIQEKGLDDELASFPSYSKEYKKRKEKKQGSGAVAHRNLTLSGDMFRQTGIKSAGIASGHYEVVVGGLNQNAQNKINYNADEIGDFLKVSNQEDELLREDYDDELQRLVKESGLAA